MNGIEKLCLLTLLYFIIVNSILCDKKYKQRSCKSPKEGNKNIQSKNAIKIKVIIAPCYSDHYTIAGTRYEDIVGCKKKLIIKIKIRSNEEEGSEHKVISIREVVDYRTNRKMQLLHPLVVKIKQQNVYELYSLDPKQNINGLVREEVINNENSNFKGCEMDTNTPTCGFTYLEDSIIPYSGGFCCSCDPKVNKARQPCEVKSVNSQQWLKSTDEQAVDYNFNERKSRNIKDMQDYSQDNNISEYDSVVSENGVEDTSEDLLNFISNEMLPDVKIQFQTDFNDAPYDVTAKNVLNITVNKERVKRQHNKDNRQIRGLQKCNASLCNVPKGLDKNTYFESAHCLRFSDLWYTAFKLGNPNIDDELSIKVYAKHAPTGPKAGYCWEDLTKQLIVIGSLHRHFLCGNRTISASYKTVEDPNYSLNHIQSYLLIPQPLPHDLHYKYPQASGNPEEYLVVEKDELTLEGKECDKAGVSFEAFSRQPGRCSHKRQSCLKNQPIHFWQQDMKARRTGRKGRYFLENFVKHVSAQPIFANRSSGEKFLKFVYRHNYTRVIEVHVKADHITVLKSGSFGLITQVYTDAVLSNVTKISAAITNLDITAATFMLELVNCSSTLAYTNVEVVNDVIPPQHSKTFTLTVAGVLASENTYCEMQVINIDKVVVASRQIVLEKSRRCMCAWHCQCVCDTDSHMPCVPLSNEDYNRAGYLGQLPMPVYKGFPMYLPIIQCTFCIIVMMLFAGVVKAILGLYFTCIGSWGLWVVCPNRARALRRYREDRFTHEKVRYDAEGFPLHPVKNTRHVKFMPWYCEFLWNSIFFIWSLKSMCIYKYNRPNCYETLSSNETEHLVSGRYVTRSSDTRDKTYTSTQNSSLLTLSSFIDSDYHKSGRKRGSHRQKGSQELLAEKFVAELIEAYVVYRNLNRPIGGVNFIPGTPYSIRGFFLRNENGKYEFNPPSPFKQHWMMDRTPIKPPLQLNPKPFHIVYDTAKDVLIANEITTHPRGVVVNMR